MMRTEDEWFGELCDVLNVGRCESRSFVLSCAVNGLRRGKDRARQAEKSARKSERAICDAEARKERVAHKREIASLRRQLSEEAKGAAPHKLRVMQENERLSSAIASVIGAARFAAVHGSRDGLIDALDGAQADVSDECNALDDAQHRANSYQRLYAEERAALDSLLTEEDLSGGCVRRNRAIKELRLRLKGGK